MAITRKPFQGVINIIRFNWHFYVLATIIIFSTLSLSNIFPSQLQPWLTSLCWLATAGISVSLVVSYYIYDFSNLYELNWLPNLNGKRVLTVNAGFDETSEIILDKFPATHLTQCDFYNPAEHTEVSIKRARKAYPPGSDTISVRTNSLPFANQSFDTILVILSAHEIRDEKERGQFFSELNRVLAATGEIYVTEHLRDGKNFLAYTVGFFHFFSRTNWLRVFKVAYLSVKKEMPSTPFITTFVLQKNGTTS